MDPWQVWQSLVVSNYTSLTEFSASDAVLRTLVGEDETYLPFKQRMHMVTFFSKFCEMFFTSGVFVWLQASISVSFWCLLLLPRQRAQYFAAYFIYVGGLLTFIFLLAMAFFFSKHQNITKKLADFGNLSEQQRMSFQSEGSVSDGKH